MKSECPGPALDGLLDGELTPAEAERVRSHLESCAACASEARSRRQLKAALRNLALPAPLRPMEATRRFPIRAAAAAAVAVFALALFAVPAPLPAVVTLTSRLHDDVLAGRMTPRDLGLRLALPGAQYVGECPCPPDLGPASPFIVYRKGDATISLLLSETPPRALPASARREHDGREYHAFRAGANTAILCVSEKLCHVWVSRLPEPELVATILATREGQSLFAGERLTLAGVT